MIEIMSVKESVCLIQNSIDLHFDLTFVVLLYIRCIFKISYLANRSIKLEKLESFTSYLQHWPQCCVRYS